MADPGHPDVVFPMSLISIKSIVISFFKSLFRGEATEVIETLRYPEIGVRVTGSAMVFSFCGDVIDLTR